MLTYCLQKYRTMNFKRLVYITGAITVAFLSSCKPTIDLPKQVKGNVDFTNYVAIGNSLTAGYEDGGLYLDGQINSYPNMIAGQLKAVGGGPFVQPLFTAAQKNGSGYLQLTGFTTTGLPLLDTVKTNLAIRGVSPLTGLYLYTKYTDPVNNLGVPGIRMSDLVDNTYGAKNPYLERLEKDAEVGTVGYPQKVLEAKPTFFTSWLGNNDALQYALSGGTYPPLTPVSAYQAIYTGFIGQLVATGAKGVLGTIPNVTLIPYFNTKTVANIIAAAQAGGAKVNALYIRTGTGSVRAATSADLIVLSVDSIGMSHPGAQAALGPKGFSPYYPLNSNDVLDSAEVGLTEAAISGYNTAITQIAAANKLGLMDINELLHRVQAGNYIIDGIPLNLGYITGGVFSLDGVHLTPRGYAMVANQYIGAINAAYSTNISPVNPALYRAVKLP